MKKSTQIIGTGLLVAAGALALGACEPNYTQEEKDYMKTAESNLINNANNMCIGDENCRKQKTAKKHEEQIIKVYRNEVKKLKTKGDYKDARDLAANAAFIKSMNYINEQHK